MARLKVLLQVWLLLISTRPLCSQESDDDEIIENLEILENMELLDSLEENSLDALQDDEEDRNASEAPTQRRGRLPYGDFPGT